MQYVRVWDLMGAIGSEMTVSANERAATLRLDDEVAQVGDPNAPSPLAGKTMGDLRQDVITGLSAAFARAYRISRSAAVIENFLHHTPNTTLAVYDLRQTGLPRLSTSARTELGTILVRAAQFEKRLVSALSAGAFRRYPRHGGPRSIGVSPDAWSSDPNDSHAVCNIVLDAAQIMPLLREAEFDVRSLREAFTAEPIQEDPAGFDSPAPAEPPCFRENLPPLSSEPTLAGSRRSDDLTPTLVRALREVVISGVPVHRLICSREAYRLLSQWADGGKFKDLLTFLDKKLAYYVDDNPEPLTKDAVRMRVTRLWEELLPQLQQLHREATSAALRRGKSD
jgi:hypothetical protein